LETPPPSRAIAHVRDLAVVRPQILRDGDVYLFGTIWIIGYNHMAGDKWLPNATRKRVDQSERPMRGSQSKERFQFIVGLGGIAYQQRFSVPIEPKIAV